MKNRWLEDTNFGRLVKNPKINQYVDICSIYFSTSKRTKAPRSTGIMKLLEPIFGGGIKVRVIILERFPYSANG